MSAENQKALSVNPGVLEVATNPGTITALLADGSNAATVRAECDALTFLRVASVIDLQISQNFGDNIIEIVADDTGTIFKASLPSVVISANWYEIGETDVVTMITGAASLDVAATPVAVTTEIILAASSGSVAKGAVYVLAHKNAAGTVVTSVTVDVAGTPLVANTDYTIKVDSTGAVTGTAGESYITFLAATTNNAQVDVDYTYTPAASTYTGFTIKSMELESLVVRITSTDPTTSKVKVDYLIDCGFEGELVEAFVDINRAGDLPNSPLSFTGNKNGTVLRFTDDL